MKKETAFISSERYAFDFSKAYKSGEWRQYDTDQDAWYFGVWFSPATLQVLTYAEGDLTLESLDAWSDFKARLESMDEFYGGPPPAMVAADGINVDMTLENPVAYYDENARLGNEAQPARLEALQFSEVRRIFLGIES